MEPENPYQPPASGSSRKKRLRGRIRNHSAKIACWLTAVFPIAALSGLTAVVMRNGVVVGWMENLALALFFVSAPCSVFAVVLGIIGAQGQPTKLSLAAMILGGLECAATVIIAFYYMLP